MKLTITHPPGFLNTAAMHFIISGLLTLAPLLSTSVASPLAAVVNYNVSPLDHFSSLC